MATLTNPAENAPRVMTLDDAVLARHSTRRFRPTPVPKSCLQSALDLATHAPSNSNIQPWRLYLLSGHAIDRVKSDLVAAASSGETPMIPPLPDAFRHFRSELGLDVYGKGLGIAYNDTDGRRAAVLRNFDFFGAPTAAIVCMQRDLSSADAVSVGMYLQTLLLGLAEEGLGSCVEVSVAGYPTVIRDAIGIPEDYDILCGVAIGYEDPDMRVNHIRSPRARVEETTVMLDS